MFIVHDVLGWFTEIMWKWHSTKHIKTHFYSSRNELLNSFVFTNCFDFTVKCLFLLKINPRIAKLVCAIGHNREFKTGLQIKSWRIDVLPACRAYKRKRYLLTTCSCATPHTARPAGRTHGTCKVNYLCVTVNTRIMHGDFHYYTVACQYWPSRVNIR
jgi:hypothetical protein